MGYDNNWDRASLARRVEFALRIPAALVLVAVCAGVAAAYQGTVDSDFFAQTFPRHEWQQYALWTAIGGGAIVSLWAGAFVMARTSEAAYFDEYDAGTKSH